MKKFLIGFGVIALAVSCKSTSEVTDTGGSEEMPKTAIGEGKVVFLKKCTTCHGAKKIEDYTKAQWDGVLPPMIKKAELSSEEAEQVSAYIYWELENN